MNEGTRDVVCLASETSSAAAQLETLACYVDAAFQEPPTADRVSPELLCDTLRATAEHLTRISDDLWKLEQPQNRKDVNAGEKAPH